jgi:hypothetical protein
MKRAKKKKSDDDFSEVRQGPGEKSNHYSLFDSVRHLEHRYKKKVNVFFYFVRFYCTIKKSELFTL